MLAANVEGLAKKGNWHYRCRLELPLLPPYSSAQKCWSSPFFAKPYVSRCFCLFRNILKIITKKFGGMEICYIFV
jgi:hypothetical protein